MSLQVQLVPGGQNDMVFSRVALRWTDVANAAVAVIKVVTVHKRHDTGARRFEVVALSKHVASADVVQAFFRRAAIRHLRQYPDAFGQSSRNWATAGIPLTPLVDLR